MGERSMTACLQEHVDTIRDALPATLPTFALWYDEGMPFEVFDFGDDTHREAVSYAAGYLQGAADQLDVTIGDLLDEEGVLTNQLQPTIKPRKRRKVSR